MQSNAKKIPHGPFVIVSGPSGAGKTRLITKALEDFPFFANTVSWTTRKPRAGEKDGDFYHFVGLEEFERMKSRGEFAEWAKVHDDFYASSKKELNRLWDRGLGIIKDIDVQGFRSLKKLFPHLVSVFVFPPSFDELNRRLLKRGALSERERVKRLSIAAREMDLSPEYDFKIVNDSFEEAYRYFHYVLAKSLKRG